MLADGQRPGRPFSVDAAAVVVAAGAHPDAGAADPLRRPLAVGPHRPRAHRSPRRPGDRRVRRAGRGLEGRAPGLPGAGVRGRGHHPGRGQPPARPGRPVAAVRRRPPGSGHGRLPPHGERRRAGRGHHHRTGPHRAGRAAADLPVTDHDVVRVTAAVAQLAELLFAAGAHHVYLPSPRPTPAWAASTPCARLPRPRADDLELFTVHLMGTAAMGGDPIRHVCDPSGRLWDAAGLYVADASLFPSPVGVNPMETIMALGSRCAMRSPTTSDVRGERSDGDPDGGDARAGRPPAAPSWRGACGGAGAPDPAALAGWEYVGLNTARWLRAAGADRFVKGFAGGHGYNRRVRRRRPDGAVAGGRRAGARAVRLLPDLPGRSDGDRQPVPRRPPARLRPLATGRLDPAGILRDYLVAIDDSHDLLLGHAFSAVGPLRLPASFFVLERFRRPPQPVAAPTSR